MTASRWWNRTRYRLYAPIYDWIAKPFEHGRARAVDRLDLEPGEHVLLLGSGTGSDLQYIPDGVTVTAIDLTPAMVRRTAARGDALDRQVASLVGDAQSLPFPDGAFDAVVCHLLLTVVPDPAAVAAETERVLAPDGRVSIYDKFVPAGTEPSLLRQTIDPVTSLLFSSVTRQLEPILADTDLVVGPREHVLRGLYTVTVATPAESQGGLPESG